MRNFLIALFILFEFLFSTVQASSDLSVHKAIHLSQNISKESKKEIYSYSNFEHAVLRLNNDSEIYTASIQESGSSNHQKFEKYKFLLSQNVYINPEKIYSNSHNISSYLENEICTRAP